MGKFKH